MSEKKEPRQMTIEGAFLRQEIIDAFISVLNKLIETMRKENPSICYNANCKARDPIPF